MNITQFKIKNLYGRQNCAIKFRDNRLILVGENGAGKTTVLRILFLLLSGQWVGLSKYNFESVSIKLNNETITVPKLDIAKSMIQVDRSFFRQLPSRARELMIKKSREGIIDYDELMYIYNRYGISDCHTVNDFHSLYNYLGGESEPKSEKKISRLKTLIANNQILYLPTYRRIEQELSYILNDFDIEEFKKRQRHKYIPYHNRDKQEYTELVEFGMVDVKNAIQQKLDYLKEFTRDKLNNLTLGYLSDVVDKKYTKVDVKEIKSVEDETIKNILDRIDDSILRPKSKKHLVDTIQSVKDDTTIKDDHQKVICHYFSKLLSFQQELEKEEQGIRTFCEVCNSYMIDKQLEYNSSEFGFRVTIEKHAAEIELSQLSSGEKQIISLFSHLYLSTGKNFFVMIDEPELSLSVPWQRKFLKDISNSDLCSGFLAATHSPFIYENELDKYAHGLGEFISEVK